MTDTLPPHPIQPLHVDSQGVERFRENAIVSYLLEAGGIDMNHLATKEFSREDREQFAQLIGYSWSGASDLGYMSNEVLEAARHASENPNDPGAQAAALRQRIEWLKQELRGPVAELYGIHPEDLGAVDGD